MNFRTQLFILAFVLFLIIFVSLSTTTYVPYSKDSLFSHEYPYEGFGDNTDSYPINASPVTSSTVTQDSSTTSDKDSKKIEGFQGLQSSPYGTESSLDIFSQLSSGPSCKPSPYSNSKGYLCLDDNASSMLATRGGNFTGKESIGSPSS